MMNVLVTGGAGFIGSHIVEHLQNRAEMRGLDNLRSGFKRNLNGLRHKFMQGSVLDRNQIWMAVQGVDFRVIKDSIASVGKLRATGFQSASDLQTGLQATIGSFNERNSRL
jgi:UDP-glucose 4-epimerase